MKNRIISVKGSDIAIVSRDEQDYISLTDMVRNFDGGGALIEQWLKNKVTVLFLGMWEQLKTRRGATVFFYRLKKSGRLHESPASSFTSSENGICFIIK